MARADIPRGSIGFRLAHELDGLLSGISADGVINRLETQRLLSWVEANAAFADVHPFSELVGHIEHALCDGVLTPEECQDLLFVTGKYTTVNPYFDAIRGGLQSLMGLLAGVNADRMLNAFELAAMTDWLETWSHLRGLWPYDECNALVTSMVTSQRAESVAHLQALSAQFPIAGETQDTPPLAVQGICAVDPIIQFDGRTFVFTGESPRADREELGAFVLILGGAEEPNVTKRSDYLVVCEGGSEYWAFSCYGRKVERAYNLRRSGHHVSIVHERDFWDALAGHGIGAGGAPRRR